MIREVAKDAAFQKTIQQLAAKGGKFIETDQVWSYIEETFNCQNCQFGTHVGDDLNILVNGVSIWPDGGRSHRTTKARQTHDVHTEYLFNRAKGLKIGLVEYDSVSGDDSLGSNYQAPNLLDQPRRFERLFIKHTPSRSLYEITYRIEPLNYGPAAGSGSPQGAQAGIAPQPPIQARVQPQFTIAMVLGEYRYNPFQNNWHIGWIEQDGAGLRWRNKAGAKWRLTPDLANKRLLTGTDNPYYAQGRREFKLIMSNGQVTAFQFGGETYSKP